MRGAWLAKGALVLRDDLAPPVRAAGEALVRVRLAGICATDLHMLRHGYSPRFAGVPGHEFIGEVEEADDPSLVGERVVGEINAGCGTCPVCRGGRPGHCPHRTVLGIAGRNGAFAERLVLPERNLHRVPAALPDEAAVFVEPLAAALAILEQVTIRPRDQVLLLGAGRLGQLVARVLALHGGCDLRVVARHERQAALLRAHHIRVVETDEVAAGEADLVVEATGSAAGFELARRAVRPRGTIVLKSTYRGALDLDASALVVDEITLVGSRCGPFAPALRLLAAGAVDPCELIEARFPLGQAVQALDRAAAPGALKVVLDP